MDRGQPGVGSRFAGGHGCPSGRRPQWRMERPRSSPGPRSPGASHGLHSQQAGMDARQCSGQDARSREKTLPLG